MWASTNKTWRYTENDLETPPPNPVGGGLSTCLRMNISP